VSASVHHPSVVVCDPCSSSANRLGESDGTPILTRLPPRAGRLLRDANLSLLPNMLIDTDLTDSLIARATPPAKNPIIIRVRVPGRVSIALHLAIPPPIGADPRMIHPLAFAIVAFSQDLRDSRVEALATGAHRVRDIAGFFVFLAAAAVATPACVGELDFARHTGTAGGAAVIAAGDFADQGGHAHFDVEFDHVDDGVELLGFGQ
jgi:hypothetical protein